MVLTFRDEKGSPLTTAEQDANIRHLRDLIDYLIANPTPGVSITNITSSGSSLTIHLSNGTTKGPFTLPAANFRYRDLWEPETAYLTGDFFKIEDVGLYTVLLDHTSDTEFDPEFQVGGEDAYALAIPFFAPPEGWLLVEIATDGTVTLDLEQNDKFLLVLGDDAFINVPINGYNGQPFALRIQVDTASVGTSVEWASGYLGANPSVLLGDGDETVLSGLILDADADATDPVPTAVINTLKEIPA